MILEVSYYKKLTVATFKLSDTHPPEWLLLVGVHGKVPESEFDRWKRLYFIKKKRLYFI